jgi:hypothetical protein
MKLNNGLQLGYYEIKPNYGYLIEKAPQNILEELGQQINTLQSDFSKGIKHNDRLAGEIQHEYIIKSPFQTKNYIKDLAQRFENVSQYMVSHYNPIPTLKFDELWINFQKKHEYNPIHNHSGVYSFVIWYQIPFTFEDEAKHNYTTNRNSLHGEFVFVFPNTFNTINNNSLSPIYTQPMGIDKSKEGYIAIFPSQLFHLVYPFYSSDEYRITVAGNVEYM